MGISLAVSVVLGFAMGFMLGVTVSFAMTVIFVHALMQGLSLFPAMLGAGRTKGDQGGGGEDGEGCFLHERGKRGMTTV